MSKRTVAIHRFALLLLGAIASTGTAIADEGSGPAEAGPPTRLLVRSAGRITPAGDADTLAASIDSTLERFANANAGNAGAVAALQRAAEEVGQNPAAFTGADTSANERALAAVVARHFRNAGPVVLLGASAESVVSSGADIGGKDMEALAFIVMMDAAKSARDDLKAVMDDVKAVNKEKQALRNASTVLASACGALRECAPRGVPADLLRVGANGQASAADIEVAKAKVASKLDSLSEMSEMQAMRLQVAMDRRSRLMEALSNLMEKFSETQAAVIQNMK